MRWYGERTSDLQPQAPSPRNHCNREKKKEERFSEHHAKFLYQKKGKKFTLQDQVKDPTINSNKTERRIKD